MKTFRRIELNSTGTVLIHPEEDGEKRFLPRRDVARLEASAVDEGIGAELVSRFNAIPVALVELKRIQAGISPLGYAGDDVNARLANLIKFLGG